MPSLQSLFSDFTTMFVVIDPIGTLPLFIAVTAGMSAIQRRRIALYGLLISFAILLFFIAFGQFLLIALHIRIMSFQLAGSIILFLFALTLVFGIPLGEGERKEGSLRPEATDMERAVFPLAIPSIAGPGTMLTVVLLTDNDRFSVLDQVMTSLTLAVVLGLTLALLLLSGPILRVMGKPGTIIVSRIMGLILASLAVDNALRAITVLAQSS